MAGEGVAYAAGGGAEEDPGFGHCLIWMVVRGLGNVNDGLSE